MHGKPSLIETFDSRIFTGLPESFRAGRYHSLFAKLDKIPDELKVVAVSADDGVAMAVEHKELPIAAVQFHPESIMSLDDNVGIELVHGVIRNLTKRNS
jgi:anthranilate synthase